ncbi:MAG: HAD-IA family hydrolase [Acidobacteriota bacterium]|nr:HAD-IA family hydrolase [Acidobacteriota bacterium]
MPSDAARALPAPPDAILFDLDGTIIDSRVPFVTSVNHTLAAHGRPERGAEELVHHLGPPTRVTFAELFGDDEQSINAALATYREHYNRTSPATTLVYAGIPELLRSLHGRVPLAVATSKVGSSAVMLLEHLGLAELFDVISGPEASALAEPKAATVATALAKLDGPSHAVMVGDRLYDVEGAREQGLPTIGVLWGAGSEQELRDAGAAALVSSPDEIPPLLGL